MKQAATDAGKQEIALARKGLVEAGKPVLKEIEGMGVTVTQLSPAEREEFVKITRPVYAKWKPTVGNDLVDQSRKGHCGTQAVRAKRPKKKPRSAGLFRGRQQISAPRSC